jgi:hypothetical protein
MEEFFVIGMEISVPEKIKMSTFCIKFCILNTSSSSPQPSRLPGIDIKGIIADSGFYLREFIELLENRGLVYIIAVRLYHPLQRKVYAQQNCEKIDEGIWITEFLSRHADWKTDRRFIAVRQDIKKRPHAMGKVLSLFGDEFDTGELSL